MEVAGTTWDWSVANQGKLIVGGLILLIAAAAGFGGWYYMDQKDQQASVALGSAIRTLDTPLRPTGTPAQPDSPSFASAKERDTEARKQFQAAANKYPNTRSGEFARYFVGVTSSDLGDYATAQRELKAVAGSRNADISSLAGFALASVDRQEGRNKDAIEIYKKLAASPTRTVAKTTVQLEMAAAYQADQQPLEAKRVYEQIQKENPGTDAATDATQKLNEMK
jgi:TolA-binding protein